MKQNCPDCAVAVGNEHEDNCDVARCLKTGYQRLSCDLLDHDDCGDDIWTGSWPGAIEAAEFRWYSYFDSERGWIRCEPTHPAGTPDLNRLYSSGEAEWDPEARRWRMST